MKINMNLAQSVILNREGINHLRIDVIPPEIKETKTKKPTLLIFVLDKSGSMDCSVFNDGNGYRHGYSNTIFGNGVFNPKERSRTKMEHAIESTIKVMDLLTPEDLFGVVSFDDYADISQTLTHITSQNRTTVENNVRSIRTRNSTNISSALQKAMDMITPEYKEKYNCKIILLSDGQANMGLTNSDSFSTLTLKYLQDGVIVSSLGIGYDYDSNIMNSIATSGGGLFYHVEDIDKLIDIFKEELNNSATITAKNAKLLFEIPDLIEISENLNDFKQVINGKNIEVFIGDMYTSRSIYFEMKNNFVDTDILLNAKIEYNTLENTANTISMSKELKVVKTTGEVINSEKNQEIIDAVVALLKNKTIRDSSSYVESGNREEMNTVFEKSLNQINLLSNTYNCVDSYTNDIGELDSLKNTYSNKNVSRSILKKNFATSNLSLREQK